MMIRHWWTRPQKPLVLPPTLALVLSRVEGLQGSFQLRRPGSKIEGACWFLSRSLLLASLIIAPARATSMTTQITADLALPEATCSDVFDKITALKLDLASGRAGAQAGTISSAISSLERTLRGAVLQSEIDAYRAVVNAAIAALNPALPPVPGAAPAIPALPAPVWPAAPVGVNLQDITATLNLPQNTMDTIYTKLQALYTIRASGRAKTQAQAVADKIAELEALIRGGLLRIQAQQQYQLIRDAYDAAVAALSRGVPVAPVAGVPPAAVAVGVAAANIADQWSDLREAGMRLQQIMGEAVTAVAGRNDTQKTNVIAANDAVNNRLRAIQADIAVVPKTEAMCVDAARQLLHAAARSSVLERNFNWSTLSSTTVKQIIRYWYALIIAQYAFIMWIKTAQLAGGDLVAPPLGVTVDDAMVRNYADAMTSMAQFSAQSRGVSLVNARGLAVRAQNFVNARVHVFVTWWNTLPPLPAGNVAAAQARIDAVDRDFMQLRQKLVVQV